MPRWLHHSLFALLLLATGTLIAGGVGVFWLGTDSGRTWLTGEIESRSARALHIENLQGNPLFAWSADRLLYADAGSSVELTGLRADWRIWQVLIGRLHLQSVTADAMKVTVPAGPSDIDIEALWPLWVVQLNHLALARVEYQEQGQAPTRFSRLELEHVVLGPSLSGQWAVENEAWRAQGQLEGKPKNWAARIEVSAMSGDDQLGLNLQGKGGKSGSLKLSGELASARLTLSGDWTLTRNIFNGGGDITVQQGPVLHAGAWTLQTDIGTSVAEVQIAGKSGGENLVRPLDWRISAQRESDGRLHGEMTEPASSSGKAALQLRWQQAEAGRWTANGTLDHWSVPMKGAEGTLSGQLTADYQPSGWRLDAGISEGRMGGFAASLDVQAQGNGHAWHLQRADMQMLGLSLSATGQGDVGHVLFTGKVASENLHQVFALAGLDGSSGRLNARFGISGSPSQPELTWQGEGRDIRLDEAGIGTLKGQGRWLQASREGEAKLTASGLRWQEKRWTDVQLQAKLGKEAVSLEGKARGDITAAWHLQGKSAADVWQGSLGQLNIRSQEGPWLEVREMPWRLDAERLKLGRSTLKLLGHAAFLQADLGRQALAISLDIADLPLQALSPWLDSSLRSIAGKATLHARLAGTWNQPQLDMKLTSDEIKVDMQGESSQLALVFKQMNGELSVQHDALSWKAATRMSPQGSLDTSGNIPWQFSLQPYAFKAAQGAGGQAHAHVELSDLSALQPLLPRIDPLTGGAKLNISVDEPLGHAVVNGDGEFDLPAFGIPEFGLDMSGRGKVVWQGDDGQIDLMLSSGKGKMQAKGAFSLSEKRFPEVLFTKFPLMNTSDQQLVVDGHLAGKNRDGKLWLLGNLTADPLVVVLPEIQPRPTHDLIWEEQKPTAARFENLQRTRLDVGLNLADHGQVSGRGMQLQLGGKLKIGGSVAYPLLTGNLSIVSGGIDFRNIHLDVLPDSHVIYTGDPDRPLLHVRAARRVDGMLVGVAIDGPADRPFSVLFSEPSMSQAEILSYLATGRPLASLGQNGASDAMSLAGFLLGPGTAMQTMQDKIQQSLGLDELVVDAGMDKKTVTAGKRIGDKTTVRLEEIVTTQASTAVTLEYKLFKSLSLFGRKVQNLSPTVGLKLSRQWQGKKREAEEQGLESSSQH